MNITELLQELRKLSPEERENLKRELGMFPETASEAASELAGTDEGKSSPGGSGGIPAEDRVGI